MLVKVLVGLVVFIVAFLGFASTRPEKFHYERSGVINASPETIFPFLTNFQLGSQWNPYEEKDLNMTKNYSGEPGTIGSKMEWSGNPDVGAGTLELVSMVPNESVDIRLTMTKPMEMSHMIHYRLAPEASGTKFTWWQDGENNLVGKIMTIIIDCDKMFGTDMEHGIAKLKKVVETP